MLQETKMDLVSNTGKSIPTGTSDLGGTGQINHADIGRNWGYDTTGLHDDSPLCMGVRPEVGAVCSNAHIRICAGAWGNPGPYCDFNILGF